MLRTTLIKGQTPKSDIPPNIAPKVVTSEKFLQIWHSSATLIGQLAIETLFGAILGGIPLSGAYPFKNFVKKTQGLTKEVTKRLTTPKNLCFL